MRSRFLSLGQAMSFDEANILHYAWDKQIQAYQQRCQTKYYTSPAPHIGGTNYITSFGGRLRPPEKPVGNTDLN